MTALPLFIWAADPGFQLSALRDSRFFSELPGLVWQNSYAPTPVTLDNNRWKPADDPGAPAGPYTWVRLKIRNDLGNPVPVDFRIPHADSINFFVRSEKSFSSVITGPYVAARNWQYRENASLVPLECESGKEYEIYIRLWSAPGRPFSFKDCRLQTRLQTLTETVEGYRQAVDRTEFNGFFLGAIGFALLFSLVIFLRIREKMFLFYALYLLGIAAYAVIVKTLPYSSIAKAAYLDYPLTYKLGEPVQYLSFAAYMAFGKHLLDTNQYPLLNRVIRALMLALLISGFGLLLYNFLDFRYQLQEKAFIVSRIVILPLSVILVVWIAVTVQSPIKCFFIIGSSLFLSGGLLAVLVDPKTRHLFWDTAPFSPVYIFKTGILAETFFFALALGYKLRMNQKEKEHVTRSYIEQLEFNRRLVANENLRLEKMVQERTEEMIRKNAELEMQNQKRIKSEFEKQLAELEMKALRSQINPHFIFNSLNSIRYQILKKDYKKASDYLVRFAKLLRKILQSSREQVISLQEELDMVSLYLDMERLRFSDNFSYDIIANPAIDLDEIRVPPMLIQPYVENAVKHGLIHSLKPSKAITVEISLEPEGCKIEIRDNGVGRSGVPRGKEENTSGLGLKITTERVALFNQQYRHRIAAEIIDLYENNHPSGTLVVLTYQSETDQPLQE
ncbi:histidine kinase [Ravibacter arvi]